MAVKDIDILVEELANRMNMIRHAQGGVSHAFIESQIRSELLKRCGGDENQVDEEDVDYLLVAIESLCPISEDEPEICSYNPEAEDWYTQRNPNCKRIYFNQYLNLLRSSPSFKDEEKVQSIARNAEAVLAHCSDPYLKEDKKYGLILGDVQSGKTANFLALSALAYDFGYKHVIILAGMTELLRTQTQQRAESALVHPSNDALPGQGEGTSLELKLVDSLTSMSADFPKSVADATWENAKANPIISIVKKNPTTLSNLYKFVKKQKSGAILLIDDEADQASINIKGEAAPATINSKIRKIVKDAQNLTYIACTATPFANILINTEETPEHKNGNDLFPRDFILRLKKGPSEAEYCGTEFFFGESGAYECLSMDEENTFYKVNSKTVKIEEIPDSLRSVILSFWLACAVRNLRGDRTVHRSMLVNTSVRTVLHKQIADLISEYCDELRAFSSEVEGCALEDFLEYNRLEAPGKILHDLYMTEKQFETARTEFSFEDIRKELRSEILKFQVEIFNADKRGRSTSKFSYDHYKDVGARVIAVGGLVLSRGLTVEGLICSYFCRTATAYDTLLQMGRWFGYRNGYRDLCRVWLFKNRLIAFRNVMEAVEDLNQQFHQLVLSKKRPQDFGLMVLTSPKIFDTRSFLVTAKAKSQKAQAHWVTQNYAGHYPDTNEVCSDRKTTDANISWFKQWIRALRERGIKLEQTSLGSAQKPILRNVPRADVFEFLCGFRLPDTSFAMNNISGYIMKDEAHAKWDVVISGVDNPKDSNRNLTIDDVSVGVGTRRMEIDPDATDRIFIDRGNNRVLIPSHLKYGLTEAQWAAVRNVAKAKGKSAPSQEEMLDVEDRNPLLIIYPIAPSSDSVGTIDVGDCLLAFALGFPGKKGMGKARKYLLNTRKIQEFFSVHAEDMMDDFAGDESVLE